MHIKVKKKRQNQIFIICKWLLRMNEKLFDDTVEKATEKHINQLEVYSSPIKTYELSPMQATFIEKNLNSNKYDDHMGFLLVPVRTSEQILYKSSMVEESKHFA